MGQGRQVIRPAFTIFQTAACMIMPRQHQLTFFEDETNHDDDVLRNRIRHHIIPQLKTGESTLFGSCPQLHATVKVDVES